MALGPENVTHGIGKEVRKASTILVSVLCNGRITLHIMLTSNLLWMSS